MTPRQLRRAVRLLLFTRRTTDWLFDAETCLKLYLLPQPTPCITLGEHQIALVEGRLEVNLIPLAETRQTRLPGVFEEGDLMP